MLTTEAHVETERASRYLVQLCKHTSQMGRYLRHRRRGPAAAVTRTRPPRCSMPNGPTLTESSA